MRSVNTQRTVIISIDIFRVISMCRIRIHTALNQISGMNLLHQSALFHLWLNRFCGSFPDYTDNALILQHVR